MKHVSRQRYTETLIEIAAKHPREREYWHESLKDRPALAVIPHDLPPVGADRDLAEEVFDVPCSITERLMTMSKGLDPTIHVLLLSGLAILLARHTREEDILIGTSIYRQGDEFDFCNTVLALRISWDAGATFRDLVLEVRKTLQGALAHYGYPFEILGRDLGCLTSEGVPSFFDVGLQMENIQDPAHLSTARPNQLFLFNRTDSGIGGKVVYNRGVYEKATIRRAVRLLNYILAQALFEPQIPVQNIQLLPDEQKNIILRTFAGDTNCECFKQDPVVIIRRQMATDPHRMIGVDDGPESLNRQLTAGELHRRACSLARRLEEHGVGNNRIVAILSKRSLEFFVCIAAILEAGGAYLPLDIDAPPERTGLIIRDSGTSVILTQGSAHLEVEPPVIDISLPEVWENESPGTSTESNPSGLAYVLYTSGTTGAPKGVMVERRNLCFLIEALNGLVYGNLDHLLKLSLVSPFLFDASIQHTFAALMLSHTLVIVPDDIRSDGHKLLDCYNRHCVDVADGTPVHIGMLRDAGAGLKSTLTVKYFLIGGEELPGPLVKAFFKPFKSQASCPVILNVYGPTECTVDAASFELTLEYTTERGRIPIGKPLSNTRIYILDPEKRPVPVGMAGEIWISGAGVGRGYLNRVGLTVDSFVADPFCPGLRMYRAGDLARWLEDGNIEYLGRVDNQVKLRGYRIELGEIEHCLRAIDDVNDAVADIRQMEDGERHLCAYLVPENRRPLDIDAIRDYLKQSLPYYMIPTFFIEIQSIPLTANGKLNRRALPLPQLDFSEYIPPRQGLEEDLAEIWAGVLGLGKEQISVTANFFQLGGHSLRATLLAARVVKRLDFQLPLMEIFKNPTVRGMARYIQEHGDAVQKTSPSGVVLLRKQEDTAAHLFLIHDGSGDVDGYIDLYSHNDFQTNAWGIRASRPEVPAPQNLDVEAIAASYIQRIDELQLPGPIHLIGWSLGGGIAFEMALQLQKRGRNRGMLLLVDAPGPWSANVEDAGDFTLESESGLLNQYFPELDLEDTLGTDTAVQDIWVAILDIFQRRGIEARDIIAMLPPDLVRLIPNIERLTMVELIEYLNLNRSLARARAHYKPSHTLESTLYFLKARQSELDPRQEWQSYCELPLFCDTIDGDHFSMMKHPSAGDIAAFVRERIEERVG